MMMGIGLALSLVLAAEPAVMPKVELANLSEQRNRFVAKNTSIGGFENLTMKVALQGPMVNNLHKFGNLRISEARTDTGADLIRRNDFFNSTDQPTLKNPSDLELKFGKIEVNVCLKSTPRAARKVTVKGSLEVLTNGTKINVDFPKFRSLEGTELKNAEIKAAGLKIRLLKIDGLFRESSLEYVLEGNQRDLDSVTLHDAAGKQIKKASWNSSKQGEGIKHHNFFALKVPENALLRVTLLKGAKSTTLPFVFADVELP